jgi:hypothetical protein
MLCLPKGGPRSKIQAAESKREREREKQERSKARSKDNPQISNYCQEATKEEAKATEPQKPQRKRFCDKSVTIGHAKSDPHILSEKMDK